MEGSKKQERENRKGGGGNAAGHGIRDGQGISIGCAACDGEMLGLAATMVGQQWMGWMGMDGTDGDGWEWVPRWHQQLSPLLPTGMFLPCAKGEEKILGDLLGLPRKS